MTLMLLILYFEYTVRMSQARAPASEVLAPGKPEECAPPEPDQIE